MKRVVVIGAGPAGLTAAYELLKKSGEYEVIILEQSGEVGGLAKSVYYNNHCIDLGGHKFKSNDPEIVKWWNEILPFQGKPAIDDIELNRYVKLDEIGADPETEDGVMLSRNTSSELVINDNYFEYPLRINQDNLQKMNASASARASFSMIGGTIVKRKEKSVEDTYINRYGRFMYATFFEGYTEKMLGRTPSDVSPEWADAEPEYVFAPNIMGLKSLKDYSDADCEEFYYPKYGPGYFWQTVEMRIGEMGGAVYKNCTVEHVHSHGSVIKGVSYMTNGQRQYLDADYVISTMPLKNLVSGMDKLPVNVQEVAHRLQYRDFVTVGVLVPEILLKNNKSHKTYNNISLDGCIYVQNPKCKMSRVRICNNYSPYIVVNPQETVWLNVDFFCKEGDFYWNMSDSAWKDLAIKELKIIGMIAEDVTILDSVKLTEKSVIPGYYETFNRIDEIIDFVNGFENLFCIGRNGQHRMINMDVAMKTSMEAVRNIELGRRDKSNIWKITEPRENILAEKKVAEKKSSEKKSLAKKEKALAYNPALMKAYEEDMLLEEQMKQPAEKNYADAVNSVAKASDEIEVQQMVKADNISAAENANNDATYEVEETIQNYADNNETSKQVLATEVMLANHEEDYEDTKESVGLLKSYRKAVVEKIIRNDDSSKKVETKHNVTNMTAVVSRPEVQIPVDLDDEFSQPTDTTLNELQPDMEDLSKKTINYIPKEEDDEAVSMVERLLAKPESTINSIIASEEALRPASERIIDFDNLDEVVIEEKKRATLNSAIILTQEEALRLELAKLEANSQSVGGKYDDVVKNSVNMTNPDDDLIVKKDESVGAVEAQNAVVIKEEEKTVTKENSLPKSPYVASQDRKEISQEEIAKAIANGKVIKSTKIRTTVNSLNKDSTTPKNNNYARNTYNSDKFRRYDE